MQVVGHIEDRAYSYIYDKKGFDRKLGRVLRLLYRESNLQSESPIISQMDRQRVIENMLNNVLMTVIFFICFLSFILIFSLM